MSSAELSSNRLKHSGIAGEGGERAHPPEQIMTIISLAGHCFTRSRND